MRTRRAHVKSHFGCLQCKEKRVKCDEARPSCKRCAKRGSECTYDLFIHHIQGPNGRKTTSRPRSVTSNSSQSPPMREISLSQTTSSAGSTANTSPLISQQPATFIPYDQDPMSWQLLTPSSAIDSLSASDYQMYQHYLTHVSPTLIMEIYLGQGLWNAAVLGYAETRPFLLSGMLATSALHMALSHPERRGEYIQVAMRHQSQALREYTPVVSSGMEPAEYESAFALTALLVVSAFGLQSALFKHSIETLEIQHGDPIVEIRNIIDLFRGMTHIHGISYFGSAGLRMRSSPDLEQEASHVLPPLCPGEASLDMLERDFLQYDYQRAHIDVMEALDWDFSMPEGLGQSLPAQSDYPPPLGPCLDGPTVVYIYLIRRLRQVLREMRTTGNVASCAFRWASCIPKAFSGALAVHRPLALVIVAHWAVSLHYLRSQWWADGWGVRLIATIARALGDEWRKYMLWPLQEVGLDQDDFLNRNF